jgi:hypothetical protein
VGQHLVHRPLVIGVATALARQDPAVRADQEVGGQPQVATGRMHIGRWHLTSVTPDRNQRGWHRARVEHGPRRRADTELGIERLGRVTNHRERQLADVATQLLIGRVEHDDLTDTGVGDLVVPTHDRLQVDAADRAAGETPKLQMDDPVGVGNRDRFAGNPGQFTRGNNAAHAPRRPCSWDGPPSNEEGAHGISLADKCTDLSASP